jgi:hypothetical protein
VLRVETNAEKDKFFMCVMGARGQDGKLGHGEILHGETVRENPTFDMSAATSGHFLR